MTADQLEDAFWHECADVPDLDTSRYAVRRALEFALATAAFGGDVQQAPGKAPQSGPKGNAQ